MHSLEILLNKHLCFAPNIMIVYESSAPSHATCPLCAQDPFGRALIYAMHMAAQLWLTTLCWGGNSDGILSQPDTNDDWCQTRCKRVAIDGFKVYSSLVVVQICPLWQESSRHGFQEESNNLVIKADVNRGTNCANPDLENHHEIRSECACCQVSLCLFRGLDHLSLPPSSFF
jgi:hypothetical protein